MTIPNIRNFNKTNILQKIPPDLFYEATEQAHVAILIADLKDNILYTNPAFKRINPTVFLNLIKNQFNNKDFTEQEFCFKPNGYHLPRWFICNGTWHNEYFLLLAKEITTNKRQQEDMQLNALRALLAEEELTEAMRETLAGAIHQLQVPINLISAALSLLKRRGGQKEPLYKALQETLESVNHAVEHLHHCLPISENNIEPVNLNELIRDVLMISTQRLLAEGIIIDWKPALILPSVLGHVKRLRGMFKQLIDNSIDSMNNIQGQRELYIVTSSQSDLITVSIEDTGKGIPEDLHFKIFEPFFTTKKAGAGTGMGLAAVQDIVNMYAGTIRIDPNYTQGSRFIIQFPTS